MTPNSPRPPRPQFFFQEPSWEEQLKYLPLIDPYGTKRYPIESLPPSPQPEVRDRTLELLLNRIIPRRT